MSPADVTQTPERRHCACRDEVSIEPQYQKYECNPNPAPHTFLAFRHNAMQMAEQRFNLWL
jgi:hypothetical protein